MLVFSLRYVHFFSYTVFFSIINYYRIEFLIKEKDLFEKRFEKIVSRLICVKDLKFSKFKRKKNCIQDFFLIS